MRGVAGHRAGAAGAPLPRDGDDARHGSREIGDGSRRAARDGVGRGLRDLYAGVLDAPLPDDLRELLGRLPAAPSP